MQEQVTAKYPDLRVVSEDNVLHIRGSFPVTDVSARRLQL
jgi:hypothetical protein